MKIRTTFAAIIAILYGTKYKIDQQLNTDGSANLLIFGNKAYYLGGGWWYISSYSSRDLVETKRLLTAA